MVDLHFACRCEYLIYTGRTSNTYLFSCVTHISLICERSVCPRFSLVSWDWLPDIGDPHPSRTHPKSPFTLVQLVMWLCTSELYDKLRPMFSKENYSYGSVFTSATWNWKVAWPVVPQDFQWVPFISDRFEVGLLMLTDYKKHFRQEKIKFFAFSAQCQLGTGIH